MQKKILITFLFKEGAGPVFTLEMARGLAQNGCEVHALLSSKISNKKDWENEKAFKSITFIETGTRKTAVQTTIDFFLIKTHINKKISKPNFRLYHQHILSSLEHNYI